MKALGQEKTKKECKAMIKELDTDGDGDVDIDEFLVLIAPSLLSRELDGTALTVEQQQSIKAAFEKFDTDGSGEIDAIELQAAMHKLGHDMSMAQCEGAIESVDEDGDGNLDLNEFFVLMAPIIIEEEKKVVEARLREQEEQEAAARQAIAERKRRQEQALLDERLNQSSYNSQSTVFGDNLPRAPDGGKPSRRRRDKKHRKVRAAGDAAMVAHRGDADETRGPELPGAAPRPLPRPPRKKSTRKDARGMGGSKRAKVKTKAVKTSQWSAEDWAANEAAEYR